jgi:hypothetical protein
LSYLPYPQKSPTQTMPLTSDVVTDPPLFAIDEELSPSSFPRADEAEREFSPFNLSASAEGA